MTIKILLLHLYCNNLFLPYINSFCLKFRVEMTARMSPEARFVAWTPESSLFEEASDVRNFEVSIQDRALVNNGHILLIFNFLERLFIYINIVTTGICIMLR